ncbi:MAG: T9SS type A sorting domain-containing protein [Ignavibacteria bacterium]|nr:T9SS type A sorting domain-containing protein [Ignavibacteria bacterium]
MNSSIFRRFLFLSFTLVLIIPQEIFSQAFNYPIVFVSRNHEINGNIIYPQAGLLPGMGSFSRFKVTGGKLMMRDASGNISTLIDSTMDFGDFRIIDVQQPCVHWNGHKVIFSGIEHRDSSWRIYELYVSNHRLNKLTFTDRDIDLSQFGSAAYKFTKYDDIDPVYLPDGKVIFASTRFPTLSLYGGVQTTNLYIIDTLGTNMFRVTTERNGAEKPTIDPASGRILYSRWWVNIDRPSNITSSGLTRTDSLALTNDIANIWQVSLVNPDGDALKQYATDPRNRKSMFSYRPRVMPDGKLLSIFIPHLPMFNTGGSPGIRYYNRGFSDAYKVIGVDSTTPLYVQSPPSFGTMQPPYATDPVPAPDGKILFSYATTVVQQDYGIYTCDLQGTGLTQVVDFPGTLELNAELLLPRATPPLINYLTAFDTNLVPPTTNPNTFYQGGLFRFDCMNVYSNAPVDAPIENAPLIKKNAKFRFFINFQRQNENGQDNPILFREIALDRDGKIAQGDIPANISMFEQMLDSNNHVMNNEEDDFAHVLGLNFGNNGSGTKCVGCHVGHTMITVPNNVTESAFTNLSTSAKVRESSFKNFNGIEYKGQNTVDRKARNQNLGVNWIADGGVNEYVVLRWEIPVDIRRLILYDIIPNTVNGTDIHVTDCEVFIYKDNNVIKHIPSTGPLDINGATVQVSPIATADSVKIAVKSFTGNINGQPLAGIAEVETSARVSSYDLMKITNTSALVTDYRLEQNYPNPFNPSTQIRFSLPKAQNVTLEVFDVTGKSVALLISGRVEAGNNSIPFIARDLPSGMYLYILSGRDFSLSRKMILLK